MNLKNLLLNEYDSFKSIYITLRFYNEVNLYIVPFNLQCGFKYDLLKWTEFIFLPEEGLI